MKPLPRDLAKRIAEYRGRAQAFGAAVAALRNAPDSPEKQQLLAAASGTMILVGHVTRAADEAWRWLQSIGGTEATEHPVAVHVFQTVARTAIGTMGAQQLKIERYLKHQALGDPLPFKVSLAPSVWLPFALLAAAIVLPKFFARRSS